MMLARMKRHRQEARHGVCTVDEGGIPMKRFIWTVLATAVSSMGAAYALRALDRMWCAVTSEPPPAMPAWARFLVARPLKRQVEQRVHPGTP